MKQSYIEGLFRLAGIHWRGERSPKHGDEPPQTAAVSFFDSNLLFKWAGIGQGLFVVYGLLFMYMERKHDYANGFQNFAI